MNHELKTWPEFWDAIRIGAKTFELRFDDRGFAVGDVLELRRWRPNRGRREGLFVDVNDKPWTDAPEGREYDQWRAAGTVFVQVTYKLPGGRFGLQPDWCVLGFARLRDVERRRALCQATAALLAEAGFIEGEEATGTAEVPRGLLLLVQQALQRSPDARP